MFRSTLRGPLAAASLLACVVASQATAAPRSDLAVGRRLADLSTLPASPHGNGFVGAGSDAFSPAALRSAREALAPGYLAAELHRDGSALRATLVYAAGSQGVVVERTGTVSGERVSFAPGAVVTRLVADPGTVLGRNCAPTCMTPADLKPDSQTVTGLGQSSGYGAHQANFTFEGSALIAAAREITIPFTTCSASQCTTIRRVPSQTGVSFHTFAPLGCDQVGTVHGWIEYDTGWKYDSVTVTIANPSC